MDITREMENLITTYGADKVLVVAKQLLGSGHRPIPAEHLQIISPEIITRTLNHLECALTNVVEAGEKKEITYGNKAELIQQKTQLETAIQLTEAEAFMNVSGEGKEQHGWVDGKKIILSNDANRDAYKRAYSAKERLQAADVCGQISAIDVTLSQANDAWQAAVEAAHLVQAKANLQAMLLNFLAGRQ